MTRRALRLAAGTLLAAALLAWLTRGVAWTTLAATLRPVPWWTWTAAIAGLAASYGFRALRIHAELRARYAVRVPDCLVLMLLHNAAVNVVPMRGGEAAYPWLASRRLGVPVSYAVASLVWMRAQDAIVLAFLASALWPGIGPTARVAAACALAAAVLAGLASLERVAKLEGRVAERWPLRPLRDAARALALAPRHGWAGWVWSVASWTVKLAAIGGLLAALSGLDALAAWTSALGGELAGVLPLQGPAGLGTYEAGVWAGAALRGTAAAHVAAAALAVHLLSVATSLVAGAIAHAVARTRAPRAAPPALEQDHA